MNILKKLFLFSFSLISLVHADSPPGWMVSETKADDSSAWLAESDQSRPGVAVVARPEPLTEREAAVSLRQAKRSAPGLMARGLNLVTVTPGGNEADTVTPEIEELARGLMYDPVKIFKYVHNFIKFEAYFGSKKDAHLTLLEGGGNEHDQSALLIVLLRASGKSPIYKYGPCLFTFEQLAGWYGISETPFSHWTNAQMGAYYYTSQTPSKPIPAGFPSTSDRKKLTIYEFLNPRGYPYIDAFDDSGYTFFSIPHVWVELDGQALSPSYKGKTIRPGVDLTAVTGYSRPQIASDVAGSVNPGDGARWVSGLSYSALSARLAEYTQNFISNVKANHDWRQADRITESTSTNQESYDTLDEVAPIFPDSYAAGVWLPFETWTAIPVSHMSKIQIRTGVWNATTKAFTSTYLNQTINLPALRGKKLSLSFVGNSGRVYLDETLVGSAFTIPGASTEIDLQLSVTHNHYELKNTAPPSSAPVFTVTNATKSNQSEVKKHSKGDDCAYAIIYSFSNPDRLSRVRQEKLDEYRRNNVPDTDWRVRTEALNVIGLNWLYQCYQSGDVIAGLYSVDTLDHHTFGRVGQERSFGTSNLSFYIDVGLIFSANNNRTTEFAKAVNFSQLSSTYASAMEHGVLEQIQGEGLGATSTVKMIFTANSAGQKIFRATKANWTTVNSELFADYPVSVKTEISNALTANAASRALMPQSGKLVQGQYKGFGFALEEPTAISMKIGANFGGFNTQPGQVSADQLLKWLQSSPSYHTASSDLNLPYDPLTILKAPFCDPVDVGSGAWISDTTDLSLGAQDPLGLALTRSYNSNARYSNGSGLGFGWSHNYDIRANRRSSVKAGLGATNTYQAAPFFAALAVARDFGSNHTTAKEWATACLAINWSVDQLKYKSVAISKGLQTMEFIEMPNGNFIPPAGVNMTLVKVGAAQFDLTQRHGSTMRFNSAGRAEVVTSPYGKTQNFTYSGSNLTKVKDAYARELIFSWAANQISSVTDSTGRSIGFAYSSGNLTGVTDPEGKTMNYGYDGDRRVIWVKDAMGRTTVENEYDAKSRVIVQRNQGDVNKTYNIYYSGFCNIEEDPEGGKKTHYYDARGRLLGTENALGNVDFSSYDGQDRRTFYSSPTFDSTFYSYDSENNMTEVTDSLFRTSYYDYDVTNQLSVYTDNKGGETSYTYNPQHSVLTVTDQLSNAITYTYDGNGNVETEKGPTQNTTTFGYDGWGQLNKITYEDGNFQSFTNNARGDRTESKDPEGRITSFTFNARRQNLTSTLAAVGGVSASSTQTYDDAGNLATSTDPNGNLTSYSYDALGKPLVTTMAALPAGANVITNIYNSRDLLESSSNSNANSIAYEYNSAHRLIASVDPLNRRTEQKYDPNGRLTEVKDPLLRVTKQRWNDVGEMDRDTDGLNRNANYQYDDNGNRTVVENRRGKSFVNAFDASNRLQTLTTPGGKTTTTTYFDDGQLHTVTEPSLQQTTFGYDDRNFISTKTDALGTISYDYDKSGLPKTTSAAGGNILRTYDARGRLKSFQNSDGDLIQYEYDPAGNLKKVIYPDPSIWVAYEYNARNLLSKVIDWGGRETLYHYDKLGRLEEIVNHNETKTQFSRTAVGEVTGIKESHDGKLFSYLRFERDAAGQIKSRFAAPIVGSGFHHPAFTAAYDDDNRLTTVNGQAVSHDADGNMTSGPISPDSAPQNLTYNARNQMTTAPGFFYTYDAEGRRTTITDSSSIIREITDPSGVFTRTLVREKTDTSVAPQTVNKTYYVYGLGLLYEVNETGEATNYHYDQVGSTLARTNDSGAVIGRADYSPYGLIARTTGDMDTPFLYNGQFGVISDANGLLYMRARYYSPYLMRFINPDPIGFSGGMNWFAYADGNPISSSDPFGLAPYEPYPVRQPHNVWDFFAKTLPDTAVATYKGIVSIPGQIAEGGTQTRRQAQADYGKVQDPITGSIVTSQWVIGAGLELLGGVTSVVKTPENVYNAGEYHASSSGLLGQREQNKAVIEDFIFDAAVDAAWDHPKQAYNVIIDGREIVISGQIMGGLLRSQAISSALASSLGGSQGRYTPLTIAIGATNIYGGVRGDISDVVSKIK